MDQRSSASDLNGSPVTRPQAVLMNFRQLFSTSYINYLILLYSAAAVWCSLVNWREISRRDVQIAAILLIPVGISVCWYLILANHSVVHVWLHAYRTAAPAVFAFLCALDLGDVHRGFIRRGDGGAVKARD